MYLIRSCAIVYFQVPYTVLDLILSYSSQSFIPPVPAFTFCDLGGVPRALPGEDGGKTVIEYLSLLNFMCNQDSHFLLESTCVFPNLPFMKDVLVEVLVVALDIPGHIQFYLGFSYPNLTPGCSDSVSVFVPGYPSLLLPSIGFLLVFEFDQELLHPCRPPGDFASHPLCWDASFLSLEVIAADKAAFELHIPHNPLLVHEALENEVYLLSL